MRRLSFYELVKYWETNKKTLTDLNSLSSKKSLIFSPVALEYTNIQLYK